MSSDTPSKVEFALQIKSLLCIEEVKSKLHEIGVGKDDIETHTDGTNKECRLVINTIKPWVYLQDSIEGTGKRAVLVGFSDEAAVAMLDKGADTSIKGVVRICSITKNKPGVVIDGVIDGLPPNREHLLSICEFGDVSQGFKSEFF